MSEQTSLALQKAMDRQPKFVSTLSNLEKKLADTQAVLEQNLKMEQEDPSLGRACLPVEAICA